MATLTTEDFVEEVHWIVRCPNCKEYMDTHDDPYEVNHLYCEKCKTDHEIV